MQPPTRPEDGQGDEMSEVIRRPAKVVDAPIHTTVEVNELHAAGSDGGPSLLGGFLTAVLLFSSIFCPPLLLLNLPVLIGGVWLRELWSGTQTRVTTPSFPCPGCRELLAEQTTSHALPVWVHCSSCFSTWQVVDARTPGAEALGVVMGLLVGKAVGIPLFSWIAVRLGLAALPEGATWLHIIGIGLLGGIGFTMSIFVAGLAFPDPTLLDTAKVATMVSSLVAGALGVGVLLVAGRSQPDATPPG